MMALTYLAAEVKTMVVGETWRVRELEHHLKTASLPGQTLEVQRELLEKYQALPWLRAWAKRRLLNRERK